MHRLTVAGKHLADFGVIISGEGTWKKPRMDVDFLSVPGRNGELAFSNHRFQNVDISYKCGITKDFDRNFSALSAFLLSHAGYVRIEDSYHTEFFRIGAFNAELSPALTRKNKSGQFELVFHCKPQLFLRSGEQKQVFTENATIYNPSVFPSKPLLRIYGAGEIQIESYALTILSSEVYTDIDCELEEAYKDTGANNCNGNIQLQDNTFPVLEPGRNRITIGVGISKVEIIPRWWTI